MKHAAVLLTENVPDCRDRSVLLVEREEGAKERAGDNRPRREDGCQRLARYVETVADPVKEFRSCSGYTV